MLDAAFPQPLQDWALRRLAFIPQRITDIAALFVLCRQSCRSTQVGLVGENDHELGLLATRGVLSNPRSDFAQRRGLLRAARLIDGAQRSNRAEHGRDCSGEEKKTNDTP